MIHLNRNLLPAATAAALLILMVSEAGAGVLHGIEARTFNGRSGHRVASQLRMIRNGHFGLTCHEGTSSGPRRAVHTIDVPAGHPIVDVTIRGQDVSPTHDLHFRLRETCQPYLEGANPTTTTISQGATSGSAGNYRVVLDGSGSAPANDTCAYFLESRFADDAAACAAAELDMTSVRVRTYDPDVIFRDSFEP
jgi:hypothetical protein